MALQYNMIIKKYWDASWIFVHSITIDWFHFWVPFGSKLRSLNGEIDSLFLYTVQKLSWFLPCNCFQRPGFWCILFKRRSSTVWTETDTEGLISPARERLHTVLMSGHGQNTRYCKHNVTLSYLLIFSWSSLRPPYFLLMRPNTHRIPCNVAERY